MFSPIDPEIAQESMKQMYKSIASMILILVAALLAISGFLDLVNSVDFFLGSVKLVAGCAAYYIGVKNI